MEKKNLKLNYLFFKETVMKNKILLYNMIMCLFSFSNWAQKNADLQIEKKTDATANVLKIDKKIYEQNMKIKYYHVEETIPQNFGGHKRTYNVSKPGLIQTYDLGPNGKRVVTLVFSDGSKSEIFILKSDSILKSQRAKLSMNDDKKKENIKPFINNVPKKNIPKLIINNDQKKANAKPSINSISKKYTTKSSINDIPKKEISQPIINDVPKQNDAQLPINDLPIQNSAQLSVNEVPDKIDTNSYLEIIKKYESATDKKDESTDMLKKVANAYFFINELEKAEKYYSKLFSKTSDLEPAYYFHYAISLKAVGKIDKSKEYFKKFHELTADNVR